MHDDDILVAWGFMNPKTKRPQPKQEARTSDRQYDDLPRLKSAVLGALPPLVAYLVFWWWLSTGQMAQVPAVVCISVSALFIGARVVRAFRRR